MPFRFAPLALEGVVLIEARAFPDARGFFTETYRQTDFLTGGIPHLFVQDNWARSTRGVLRGLHYQKDPHAQGKLVAAVRGAIFDVAVDIRRGSPSYGRWVSAELSDRNYRMLYVPAGFAHGYCVLADEADVVYKVTSDYAPASERGIRWDDPDLGIAWPVTAPLLSEKDAVLPSLREADNNFTYGGPR